MNAENGAENGDGLGNISVMAAGFHIVKL